MFWICSRCPHDIFFLQFCLVGKSITNTWNCEDKTRMLWNRLDFPAQLGHIDMQAMDPGMRVGPPHLGEQHLPRQDFATMRDEELEQVVLRGSQLDILPIDLH